MKDRLQYIYDNIEKNGALVHNITNYVTVNDCANIQLAAGGSPIMADSIYEVEEVTSKVSSLYLNIGTLNERTLKSMLASGRKANEIGIPIILDPVGYGFTKLRTDAIKDILREVRVSVIKGNVSEILGILEESHEIEGVDASSSHLELTVEDLSRSAVKLAKLYSCIVVITGKTDIIASEDEVVYIKNGSSIMSDITGTGCMLGAILAVVAGANKELLFDACVYGVALMSTSGEAASSRFTSRQLSSIKTSIIDEVATSTFDNLIGKLRYEIR